MVHEMCSTISHAVGKLVSGIGGIDDAQEGTSRSEAVHVEKRRQEPTRRSKQAPAVRESLSSEEDSFKTDSEEDASGGDESDWDRGGDESDNDGHSSNDDGDDFVVQKAGCNDNEEGEATFQERGAVMDESKEDKEDEEEEEEKKDEDEEKEDDDDEESEDNDNDNDKDTGDDDMQGDEEDQDDNNSGGNSGNGGNNGGNEDSAGEETETDDEQSTLQYLLEEKKDMKPKGLDEAVSISVRDVVMMDEESYCKMPRIRMFEVKEMLDLDEQPIAVLASKMFQELLRKEEMELGMAFNLEDVCPKWIRKKIMREIGAPHEPKEVGVPPLPTPKKKKSVSFVSEPTVLTETVEELRAMRAQNVQELQGGKETKSAMKKSGPFQLQHQALHHAKEASSSTHKNQLETNTASSSTARHADLTSGKDANVAVSPGTVSKQEPSASQILASHPREEASSSDFQASIAHASIQPTAGGATQMKQDASLQVSRAVPSTNRSGRQPLSSLNGQAQNLVLGNGMQSANDIQRGKLFHYKASQQAVPLYAGQENIPPVSITGVGGMEDVIGGNIKPSSEAKLLKVQGKLPAFIPTVAQSPPHPQLKDIKFSYANKAVSPLEINVLDVSELLARCVPPSTNDLQSKSAIHIPAEMDGQQFQHSRSESSNVFVSEYCPAPSFDIFKYDFPTAHVDDGADRDARENALADHESSQCQVTKEPVIEIIEDEKVGNLEGIDEGYAHAEEQAMKCEHESLQYQVPKEPLIEIIDDDHVVDLEGIVGNIYQTPEKVTHNQVVVGSDSNIYSSSSSGKMVPQQFERRIIKPPPCKRSPFLDYNERKVYICKPEVSRLYASVILHGRLNEEESPDVDTRYEIFYEAFFTCFF